MGEPQRWAGGTMQVFGYVRVSTDEQAKEGVSLDAQQQQITAWATIKGWPGVAEFFIEAGVSGSVPLAERPEGKRLLEKLHPGDVVITAKLDRMFRSATDALGTLEAIQELGVSLHMIDLGGDVTGNGISKLVFTILAAVAENERDRIRERIREAKAHMATMGIFSGGRRPFGYDIVEVPGRQNENGKTLKNLVPNTEEQALLAQMRKMRAKDATYREIGAAVGIADPKTIKRILDRKVDERMLLKPETTPAPRAGKKATLKR
jgi:putative DNA-invertase from lambdoid prophage Rac